ncbi:hypothetical protein [Clostridium botulinum]|uniref:hypothetical protein n=1 Tax=Clostridium botulinum TaxID=1491 RepID=UPI001E44C8AD|nr:hypothetical protein [Clostridium botulinum]MCD3277476.1 hypothetical protein [Clostridium botulinum C/D]MCD3289245.1 hypothetical protein [Clostridium botulinum C/D]MCD3292070.1 hypothetical protein [Clostridium botulinum C/D]MCD3303805.1 hypothetical protein [Clostridium botulinum C/D]
MKTLRCIKETEGFIVGQNYKCLGVDEFMFGQTIINENNKKIVMNLDSVKEYFQEA